LGIAIQNPATPTFVDVPAGSTFYTYVEGAYAAGLVKGVASASGLAFGPDEEISRQQANSILGRYLSSQEIKATGVITGRPGGEEGAMTYSSLEDWCAVEGLWFLSSFADAGRILPAHAPGTSYLSFHEVIRGSGGRLYPTAELTRAQAVAMVLRVKGAMFKPMPPAVSWIDSASGPVAGGNTVVISGSYLLGATSVMFGDVPATSFTVETNQEIRAVAPAHAEGIVDVRVTTPRGTSEVNYFSSYTYTTAHPTITSMDPATGPAAGGTWVTLSGSNLTGVTAVMFGDMPATSFRVDGDHYVHAVAPAHAAGIVEVRVVNSNGMSAVTAGCLFEYSD
jgi:hypothetical protein